MEAPCFKKKAQISRDNQLFDRGLAKRLERGYIGFDPNHPTDSTHLQQLKDAWGNALELATYIDGSFDNVVNSGIYGHYFGDADQDKVREVYTNIWGNDLVHGSPSLGLPFWYKDDFGGRCTAPDSEEPGKGVCIAYIFNAMFNGVRVAYGHVCEQGYEKPKLGDRCDLLGSTVSTKMDVLGAGFVHEYARFDRIGAAAVGQRIGDAAYGPLTSRSLAGPAKVHNADTYRCLALEYYWTTFCGRTFSRPRESDETDNACLPGRCVIR